MRNRFKTINIVFNNLGSLLILFSPLLLIPVLIVFLNKEYLASLRTLISFLIAASLTLALGLLLRKLFKAGNPNSKQAMLICALAWILFSALGAIPFILGIGASFLDGLFETMSGFTTTGITMFTGLDLMPRSVIFWRALTQWIGGLGILTFFLIIMHRGGNKHRMFGAESHKISVDRPVPSMANTIKILWSIYTLFTLLIMVALKLAGMSFFNSLCHAITTLSTGGFSPHDASIEFYRLAGNYHFVWIEYILIFGMLLGGINFLIHYRLFKGDLKALHDNTEMRYWWMLIGFFLLIILAERIFRLNAVGEIPFLSVEFWLRLEANFRTVLFQIMSILTTTGFGTTDIGSAFFGTAARVLFLMMMVIGGCVGSTGGGIKVLRVSILLKLIKREVFRSMSPSRSISSVTIDGKPVSRNEVYRVSGLFFTWILLLVFGGVVTALLSKYNVVQSFSGMFSALGNIGPSYIPFQENSLLHPLIKLVYIFGMLAGRLEILPVLLLFSSRAWRI